MDKEKRIDACQKLENNLAFESGRAPFKILPQDGHTLAESIHWGNRNT